MTASLILACLWAVVATAIALLPRDWHWPGAAVLIVLGIPLLGFVTFQHGALVGLLLLAGGMSVLRWPVYFLSRWLRDRLLP